MSSEIKAIVFKTPNLKSTMDFFETVLGLQIKEISVRHFVVYSKGIRLVFLKSQTNFEVELYIDEKMNNLEKVIKQEHNQTSFKTFDDPNGIKIVKVLNK